MKLDHDVKLNPALLSLHPVVNFDKKASMEKIEETARDFEAMFLSEMLKPMFENIKPDPNFGGGKGEEIFQSLLLDEYATDMSKIGTLGIADMVKQQLIEMQSESSNADMARNMHGPKSTLSAGADKNV